jgi:YHS domain-containing protein
MHLRNFWLTTLCTLVICMLSACGTPFATVPNRSGEPVMLLGYDPVAYFTHGAPVRGTAAHKASLPDRTYYFANADNLALFSANPARYEPQYGGFCASGAAFAVKLGSDPSAWQIYDGRLFIFGDVLGKTAWQVDPQWNTTHADRLWPDIQAKGWRSASLLAYASKVPHYKTGDQIRAEWEAQNPSKTWPNYSTGGMLSNLFFRQPGWRAAEGFGQPALGYPE